MAERIPEKFDPIARLLRNDHKSYKKKLNDACLGINWEHHKVG